ncbi:AAA family ATPase [Nocardia sp. CA-120079]|uniref:AAA family ATPase n=1 Tax=Nocardia sp. CA-120079 TaxID=3239974 RepID=UPI003D96B419
MSTFADERDDVPIWAWSYGGKGRAAVGTLALFAGRPGAGKSTGGRWVAAEASNGTLEGHWYGQPVNVAYIAAEESARYVVKPGLRAAGADLKRVFMPRVEFGGEEVRFLSSHDMAALTRELIDHDVRLVVVDPLMSTIGARTDVNRNNEVRSLIEPWAKLAEHIDGLVLGIAHLNKSGNGDVVAGINGSSAFGEVARAVFGFAKDPDSDEGDRIMSQEKNSIGEETLALTYRIESTTVTTDSGRSADVGRFVIVGESHRTVGDVLRSQPKVSGEGAVDHEIDAWLLALLENDPVLANEVYSSANAAGYSPDKAKRAKARINKAHGSDRIEAYKTKNSWFWRRTDVDDGASEQQESPDTRDGAPLHPCPSSQVTQGSLLEMEQEGSKGASEQGSTRDSIAGVTPLDAARRTEHLHKPRVRKRTRRGQEGTPA